MTSAVRAAGGKISIVENDIGGEKSGYDSSTQQNKKYGTESSKNLMGGTGKVVAVGGKVSTSHETSSAHEQSSYNSATRAITASDGKVSVEPFKLHAAEGESKSNAGGASPSRPPHLKHDAKAKAGPKANWNKPYAPTPQAKKQQAGNTRGAKAR